jgi:hypothetical protein
MLALRQLIRWQTKKKKMIQRIRLKIQLCLYVCFVK